MKKEKLLIVEDEAVVAADLCTSLNRIGYSTIGIASSGNDAIDYIEHNPPDLVLMDIVIQGAMSGIQTAQRIRKNYNIPVVYLTAHADTATLDMAKKTEPFGYILKPFKEMELRSSIEMALYKHKMEKKLKDKENLLSTTLINISDAVITVNKNGLIKLMNPEAENLTGWNKNDALGRSFDLIFQTIDDKTEEKNLTLKDFINFNFSTKLNTQKTLISRSSKRIPIEYSCSPIIDDDEIDGMVIAFRDISSRIKSEIDLRESEEKLRLLFQNINNIIITVAHDGTILTVNRTAEGYTIEEIIWRKIYDFLTPEHSVIIKKNIKNAFLYMEKSSADIVCTGVFGTAGNWYKTDIIPITRMGEVIGVTLIASDITLQKQKEDKTISDLINSEERWRLLVKHIPDIIATINHDGKILAINKSISGIKTEELINKSIFDYLPSEEVDSAKEAIENVIKTGKIKKVINTIIPTNQSDNYYYESRIVPLKSENGIGRVLVISTDISERILTDNALKEYEEKLKKTFNAAPFAIFIIDLNGNIIDCNIESVNMFEYESKDEIIGNNGLNLLSPVDHDKRLEEIQWALLGLTKEKIEFTCLTRKKRKILIEVTSNTILDSTGIPNSFIIIARDITKQRILEEQLLQSQKMEAIGRFAGGIAHDFNNILMAITGYSELLLNQLNNNDRKRLDLEQIVKAADRAAALTRQLLAFSVKQVLKKQILDLNNILIDIEKMLSPIIGENIIIENNYNKALYRINADRGQIEQIIMNLAINACDSMPEGGKLTIKTENIKISKTTSINLQERRTGKFVCLSIIDTGTGIDKTVIKNIFEPFFSTKEDGKGTGLGLSVVYGIVKQHDGWIDVESKKGKGTIFKVYLPAYTVEVKDLRKDRTPLVNVQGDGEGILVVEDDKSVREFVETVLSKNGYEVYSAQNASEALKSYKNNLKKIDLIFSDIVLPDKDGIKLVKDILNISPDLPVILTSGYPNRTVPNNIFEFYFLKKPYKLIDLFQTIMEALNKSR